MLLRVKAYGILFGHPLFCRRIALHVRAASSRVFVQNPVHLRLAVGYLGVDVLVEFIGLLELIEFKERTTSQVPSSDFSIVSLLALQRGAASWASDLGAWLPFRIASMMAFPDLPRMSLMTVSTLMFISTSDFCMC